MTKVGFIGLGKLGAPCAEVMSSIYDVIGYDVVNTGSNIRQVNTIEEVVKNRDFVFIAVPTPHSEEYDGSKPTSHLPKKNFDYTIVKQVLTETVKYADKKCKVVLISTVLPGTVRKELKSLCADFSLIYNPYLIALGSVAYDMVNPEMIIVGNETGIENDDIVALKDFYKPLMKNNPRVIFGTWEEAESIKIFYNTFISAKLSLVNMIMDVADRLGNMNSEVVANALAESSYRIMSKKYMTPGMGDSGACHPRDNIALRWLSEELNLGYDLFDAIMESREKQAKNLALKLVDLAKQYNKDQIWIHGKSYKPRVVHCEGSYSILIGHYLEELGYKVNYIDPLTGDNHKTVSGVVLLAHDSFTTYDGQEHQDFYCEFTEGSVIIDLWGKLDKNMLPHCTILRYGK